MLRFVTGKVRSKDVKLGPTEAKPEMSNYLDNSGVSWGLRWQRIRLQCRRPEFDSWVEKIPWRMECLHTPVFLPEEFHGQRNLAGYSPWGRKESDMTEQLIHHG